jgi:hypothetical protein
MNNEERITIDHFKQLLSEKDEQIKQLKVQYKLKDLLMDEAHLLIAKYEKEIAALSQPENVLDKVANKIMRGTAYLRCLSCKEYFTEMQAIRNGNYAHWHCPKCERILLDTSHITSQPIESRESKDSGKEGWEEDKEAFIHSTLRGKVKVLKKWNKDYSYSTRIVALPESQPSDTVEAGRTAAANNFKPTAPQWVLDKAKEYCQQFNGNPQAYDIAFIAYVDAKMEVAAVKGGEELLLEIARWLEMHNKAMPLDAWRYRSTFRTLHRKIIEYLSQFSSPSSPENK